MILNSYCQQLKWSFHVKRLDIKSWWISSLMLEAWSKLTRIGTDGLSFCSFESISILPFRSGQELSKARRQSGFYGQGKGVASLNNCLKNLKKYSSRAHERTRWWVINRECVESDEQKVLERKIVNLWPRTNERQECQWRYRVEEALRSQLDPGYRGSQSIVQRPYHHTRNHRSWDQQRTRDCER
jgi:hypothetical protein